MSCSIANFIATYCQFPGEMTLVMRQRDDTRQIKIMFSFYLSGNKHTAAADVIACELPFMSSEWNMKCVMLENQTT